MPHTIVYISAVQDDYNSRVSEIERYFAFLRLLDSGKTEVTTSMSHSGIDQAALFKTLKANCFLLLYNLMESVTKNAIRGIYDHMRSEGTNYDQCCDALKKVVLKNIRHGKLSIDKAHGLLTDITRHIVTETFLAETLLSGSEDAQSLRELAKEYGVSPKLKSHYSDGSRLVDVKGKRNALAHGSMTFNDVGKDFSLSELGTIKTNVFVYMQQFIFNVEDYLQKRQYLSASQSHQSNI